MIQTVDAICLYEDTGKFVIIRRLTSPKGFAFPGGKVEGKEPFGDAIKREVKEETGLDFSLQGWLPKVYDSPNRDPRGMFASRVAYGVGYGVFKNETAKTEVILLSKKEIISRKKKFVFDHFKMFEDYQFYVSSL